MIGKRNPNHYNPEEPGKALEINQKPKENNPEIKVEVPVEKVIPEISEPAKSKIKEFVEDILDDGKRNYSNKKSFKKK